MTDRPMRRKDRLLTEEQAATILAKAEYGTLSTVNSDGSPYGIPMSFAYKNGVIYLHGALEGQKLDNIKANAEVCLSAVTRSETIPEKFSVDFASAIAQGTAAIVDDPAEKKAGLMALIEKYCPDHVDSGIKYVDNKAHAAAVIKITVSKLTGKARNK